MAQSRTFKFAFAAVISVPSTCLAQEQLRVDPDEVAQLIQAMPDPAECLRHPTPENCGHAFAVITNPVVLNALKGKVGQQLK